MIQHVRCIDPYSTRECSIIFISNEEVKPIEELATDMIPINSYTYSQQVCHCVIREYVTKSTVFIVIN